MASSVASERAFSSAGIMISKCRNWLNGDIVEAIQCLKSLNNPNLMLRALLSVTDEEVLLDNANHQLANQDGSAADIVNNAEDWTGEADVKDAGKVDNIDNVGNLP